MSKIFDFMKNHFDFKIYNVTWIPVLVVLLIIPCVMYLPAEYGYENGLLENMQMIFLFGACIMGFCVKKNKKFFKFVSLVIIILMLREINCGRTLFFPIPGEVNAYYGWKDIKYGYLAHPIYGLYIASVVVYFLWNKLFINLWNIIKNVKFPVWNILLMILGIVLGLYAEKATHNFVFEEMAELLVYTSLVGIIWLYGFNKNFQVEG
ncbi:hypothetical protein IJ750_00225 [bacterium]|nr:hypothetical protein [bacterium]